MYGAFGAFPFVILLLEHWPTDPPNPKICFWFQLGCRWPMRPNPPAPPFPCRMLCHVWEKAVSYLLMGSVSEVIIGLSLQFIHSSIEQNVVMLKTISVQGPSLIRLAMVRVLVSVANILALQVAPKWDRSRIRWTRSEFEMRLK